MRTGKIIPAAAAARVRLAREKQSRRLSSAAAAAVDAKVASKNSKVCTNKVRAVAQLDESDDNHKRIPNSDCKLKTSTTGKDACYEDARHLYA